MTESTPDYGIRISVYFHDVGARTENPVLLIAAPRQTLKARPSKATSTRKTDRFSGPTAQHIAARLTQSITPMSL